MIRPWLLAMLAAVLAAADPVAQSQALVLAEDTALTVTLAGSDADGDALTYEITALPVAGTLFDGAVAIAAVPHAVADPGRAVRYVPAADDNGPGRGSFAFRVHDGSVWSPPATVAIDLSPVNDPPTMTAAATWTVAEGAVGELVITGIGPGGGADELGQTVELAVVDLEGDATVCQAYYTSPFTTGKVVYLRNYSPGTAELLVLVFDDGGGDNLFVQVVEVTITPVNDIPYLVVSVPTTVAIGGSTTITRPRLTIIDIDFPFDQTLVVNLTAVPTAGTLKKSGIALAPGDHVTMADINTGQLLYQHAGGPAGLDGFSFTYTDGVIATPRSGNLGITIGGISPPSVLFWGPDATWIEGGDPVAFAASSSVEDADSAVLAGGTLTATITGGAGPDDILGVPNIGSGAGQIGVVGSEVSYGGVHLGTVSGGAGGQPLHFDLTGPAATPAALTELLRTLRFSVSGRNPGAQDRTISVVVNDGDSGASPPSGFTMHVLPVDDPPALASAWIGVAAGIPREVVLAVDDPDTASPVLAITVPPAKAAATLLDAAGRIRLVPGADALGSDQFTVVLDDGVNPSVTAVVDVTITGPDDARPLPADEFPGEVVADSVLSVDIPFDCRQIGDPASLDFALAGDPPAGLALIPVSAAQPTVRATWSVPAAEPLGHRSFQILAIDPVSRSVGVLPVLLPVRTLPVGGG